MDDPFVIWVIGAMILGVIFAFAYAQDDKPTTGDHVGGAIVISLLWPIMGPILLASILGWWVKERRQRKAAKNG